MMPNKTIYVSDTDLPIFERAQELAGENLSSTIVQALRNFVQAYEARAAGFRDIVVRVGSDVYTRKQFRGRLLAKGYVEVHDDQPEMPGPEGDQMNFDPNEGRRGGPWMGREPFDRHEKRKHHEQHQNRQDWPFGAQRGPVPTTHHKVLEVYQTAKERIALYTREMPDWLSGQRNQRHWERNWWQLERKLERFMEQPGWNPSQWGDWRGTFSLEVFETLDEIKDRVSPDLFQAAKQALTGETVEKLDI